MSQRSVVDQLSWAARLLTREREIMLAPIGLNPAYVPVLLALSSGGAHTPKALSQAAEVEQPTMTATIQRMERDGLVTRKANPDDGRSALIALTQKGYDHIADMDRALGALNELLLEQFTTAERGQFLELLSRVVAVLEVQTGRAG
ncbi:MarR family transcriptional regulator [Devosia sp. BK]|uniref:MarR family winged helix-turn-helix transcriptional regulator n=1 Tax=Devosia sp. BK TaxID=2871706 RepID=UPI00293B1F12|nr:MarR family transcriptional regulator [Devosia sp. BK]MDV3252329.1 MarR family transcriptional regulator [Devosia sp. BK]